MISKTERAELRSIVKQQFKVLRSELEQREMEMHAEIEAEVVSRFAEQDQHWAAFEHHIQEITLEANRAINDALVEFDYRKKGPTERIWLNPPPMSQPNQEKSEVRRTAQARLIAQVAAAKVRLNRQEADLLKTLATTAIESEEAQAFLEAIPTVGELVPSARLLQLESEFGVEACPDE